MIRASGEHLLALFNNVLDFSALASGRVQLNLTTVEVADVLHEIAALLEGQRQGKPVAIVVDVPDFLPEIEADPTRFRQIVMNLGANALKFTQQGEVRLLARFNGREVSVSVRDTEWASPGRPRFCCEESAGGTAIRAARLIGLGLSIVREVTRLHNWQISVDSEHGTGSTFTVTMPLPRLEQLT